MGGREPARRVVDAYYGSRKGSGTYKGCTAYRDYRELLEKEKDLDAVYVATPDHWHAPISIAAMRKGKHVLCQKPMTHSIGEARRMAQVAREMKVATSLSRSTIRRRDATQLIASDWIGDGAIGTVREVHNWSSRPFWPQGIDRPDGDEPVPEGLDWDMWLGPAPKRVRYNKAYLPFVWRGWYDFGCGSFGDMGCYSFAGVFKILDLTPPTAVESTVERALRGDVSEGVDGAPGLPGQRRPRAGAHGLVRRRADAAASGRTRIPRTSTASQKNEEGIMYVGDKGFILAGFNGDHPRVYPESKKYQSPKPRKDGGDERHDAAVISGSRPARADPRRSHVRVAGSGDRGVPARLHRAARAVGKAAVGHGGEAREELGGSYQTGRSAVPFRVHCLTKYCISLLVLAVWAPASERAPMTANLEDSAATRWLNKKVLASRELDDMERTDHWSVSAASTTGVVDARVPAGAAKAFQNVAGMALTGERSRDGGHSMRLSTPTRLNEPAPSSGRGWGDSVLIRRFEGEDWSKYNRISFWVYPDCPGYYTVSLDLELHSDGALKVPPLFGQEGWHTLQVRNHEWNHVVWEIGNVARDRVTALHFAYGIRGGERGSAEAVTFDFDRLELERVDEDYVEGWGVWPGRIAYSHSGYPAGADKRALASGMEAREFELRNEATGKVVLRKPVQTVTTPLGRFQTMDFSGVRQPGSYTLAAGNTRTPAFRIGADAWRESLIKASELLLRRALRGRDSRRAWRLPSRLAVGSRRPPHHHERRLARCGRPHARARQHRRGRLCDVKLR